MFENGDIVTVKNSESTVYGYTYMVKEAYPVQNSMSLVPYGKTKEAFAIHGYVGQNCWKYDIDYLRKIKLNKICSRLEKK